MKKERIRRLLIRDSIVVAILAVYDSIVSLTHWSIPCIVYQLTGLQWSGMWDIPDASCNAARGFPCSIFFSSVSVCNMAFHRLSDPSHGSSLRERLRNDTKKSRHNSCLLLYDRTGHFHNMEKSVRDFISSMRLSPKNTSSYKKPVCDFRPAFL